MIKKIFIKNYGPFKNEEINLENKTNVIHIIGMNDVGKTVLLNAINSLGPVGLNKKFIKKEKNTSVKTVLKIDEPQDYFDEELIKKMKDENISPYKGEIEVKIEKSEYEINTSIFASNKNIIDWINNLLFKINENLAKNNKIDFVNEKNKAQSIFNDNLNQKIEKITQKIKKTKIDDQAIELIKILKSFKFSIYRLFKDNFLMISADAKDHFDFIKTSYVIKDSTDEDGNTIKSNWEDIKKFIKSFFDNKKAKEFKNIIYSDLSDDEKNRKIRTYEEDISTKMTSFFKNYFPSQNKKINFNFRFQLNNRIQILVKDETDNSYENLSTRSDGFRWFLKLYLMIQNTKQNSVIIIDEPEKFLHAEAQKELVKLLKKIKLEKRIQIIYATHSPFMLTENIYESLKIVIKTKDGSKIYNNISAYINSNSEKIRDVLSPISMTLGINLFEFLLVKQMKKIIFVEGEADIYLIEIANLLSNQYADYSLVPMLGKSNKYSKQIIDIVKNAHKIFEGIECKILFDERNDMNDFLKLNDFKEEDINSIDKLLGNKFKNPENILSEETKKEYQINQKNENGKIKQNHKIGWMKIYQDVKLGKDDLSEKERSSLIKLSKKIKEWLEKL